MLKKRKSYNKNQETSLTKVINIPKEGTILEKFLKYIETNRKKSDIISFLSVMSAAAMAWQTNITEELIDEIIEFTLYFEEYFSDSLYDEMMENWGNYPFILRVGYELIDEFQEMYRDQVIDGASEYVRKEAQTLADTIFAIRENKHLSFCFLSPEGEHMSGELDIPRTVYREDLDDIKKELLMVCINIIEGNGAMVVRLNKKDHSEIFGIRVLQGQGPAGMWVPVEKDIMKKNHLTAPNGFEFEPEEDVIYTEIQRELF